MANATKGFRRALLAAAQEARREGRITGWELFRIRTVSALAPGKLREAQDRVVDNAVACGKMSTGVASVIMGEAQGDAEAFDWMALLDFIRQLLPVILEIIALF